MTAPILPDREPDRGGRPGDGPLPRRAARRRGSPCRRRPRRRGRWTPTCGTPPASSRRSLVRVHPSFRFEERLAARLAGMAAAQAGSPRAGRPPAPPAGRSSPSRAATGVARAPARVRRDLVAAPTRIRSSTRSCAATSIPPMPPPSTGPSAAPGSRRPLIVGGAITSAAISLVGVAWVAWRASRSRRGGTMRRAPPAHPAAATRRAARRRPRRTGLMPMKFPSFRSRREALPREDVDPLPLLRGAAVQQAAREGR